MQRTLELTVEGMKCSNCEMAVSRHFSKYSGVHKVTAIKELDKVEIEFDDDLVGMEEAMRRLGEDTEFRLVEVIRQS